MRGNAALRPGNPGTTDDTHGRRIAYRHRIIAGQPRATPVV